MLTSNPATVSCSDATPPVPIGSDLACTARAVLVLIGPLVARDGICVMVIEVIAGFRILGGGGGGGGGGIVLALGRCLFGLRNSPEGRRVCIQFLETEGMNNNTEVHTAHTHTH